MARAKYNNEINSNACYGFTRVYQDWFPCFVLLWWRFNNRARDWTLGQWRESPQIDLSSLIRKKKRVISYKVHLINESRLLKDNSSRSSCNFCAAFIYFHEGFMVYARNIKVPTPGIIISVKSASPEKSNNNSNRFRALKASKPKKILNFGILNSQRKMIHSTPSCIELHRSPTRTGYISININVVFHHY